jgi:hypothetical protein
MILCNLITLNHNQQHQLSEVAFKTLHDLLRRHGHTCRIKNINNDFTWNKLVMDFDTTIFVVIKCKIIAYINIENRE